MSGAEVQRWLEARTPMPPPLLAERLAAVVRRFPHEPMAAAGSVAEALSAIGARLLADVAARGPQAPEVALDLLAADALVTYSVEAAADSGLETGAFARRILEQVVTR